MASIKEETRKKGTVYVARVRTPGKGTLTQTFAKKADAKKWAAAIEGDKARAKLPANVLDGNRKFGEFATEWMSTRQLRFRTREGYDDLLRRFIKPTFEKVQLAQITPQQVRRWHTKLLAADTKAKRSHGQTAKAYALLRTILNTAVADGILGANPCQIRGAGTVRTNKRPFIEPADVFALAESMGPRYRALILLAGFIGLRRGELLGLRRRDIDPLHAKITIERQAVRTGRNRVEGEPKTDAGIRSRPLPPFLVAELEAHMDAFTGPSPDDPVFVGPQGGPLAAITLQRALKDAREATGVTGTLHDLRHSAATVFAWSGATTQEIMNHLGHSSSAAAMRYQHAANSRDAETAQWIEAVAQRAKDEPTVRATPIRRETVGQE